MFAGAPNNFFMALGSRSMADDPFPFESGFCQSASIEADLAAFVVKRLMPYLQ
jgi:hypothetical protein